jgi:hypothetical protein
MTEKPEPTALNLLKEARGALEIAKDRLVYFGKPTADIDRKLAKIDAFLAKQD